MSDLIDRDKTLEAIQKHFNPSGEEIQDRAVAETLIGVGVVISAMPAVDTDLPGYSERLWKSAYERGKQDAMAGIVVRCKDCKYNPERSWFGCPMSGLNERQRPETAWCWKGEREGDGGSD